MRTIAVCIHGQKGDLMQAMGVLKYRNELWGEHKLVWYVSNQN
jgi:hypothetical protein